MTKPQWAVALSLGAVMAAWIGGLFLLRQIPERPARPVQVQIVGLYDEWSRCRQATAIVFTTADGRRGQGWRPTAALACHRGDWVAAEEIGASVRLTPESCRSPGPIIGSRAC